MQTKKQMMKMLNLSAISKEKKLEYFLYAVAVIIILAIYFYYNRQITKKWPFSKVTRLKLRCNHH